VHSVNENVQLFICSRQARASFNFGTSSLFGCTIFRATRPHYGAEHDHQEDYEDYRSTSMFQKQRIIGRKCRRANAKVIGWESRIKAAKHNGTNPSNIVKAL